MTKRVLIIGSTGALGSAIVQQARRDNWEIVETSHSGGGDTLSFGSSGWAVDATKHGKFDAIIWAQGVNSQTPLSSVTAHELHEVFEANIGTIVRTFQEVLDAGGLNRPSRGVIISSVWQKAARSSKIAYVISKSAVGGLVTSMTIDGAEFDFTANAVLPGVIDTPMTRANLSQSQIDGIIRDTPAGSLATPEHVAKTALWLASAESHGIAGQSVAVDNGWLVTRHV